MNKKHERLGTSSYGADPASNSYHYIKNGSRKNNKKGTKRSHPGKRK
ncbi:hypothetical protein [Paenibacillus tyrfis]|nr:hypothetical protein [Paenibacillus tyrfis]MCP1306955.1 hypothetical protein [Paenibacillus tyrfis]